MIKQNYDKAVQVFEQDLEGIRGEIKPLARFKADQVKRWQSSSLELNEQQAKTLVNDEKLLFEFRKFDGYAMNYIRFLKDTIEQMWDWYSEEITEAARRHKIDVDVKMRTKQIMVAETMEQGKKIMKAEGLKTWAELVKFMAEDPKAKKYVG